MKINEKNMCVFAKTPPFDMEGFLNKRGEVNKAFQKRYFVLKGNLLFYFERKTDKEPLGLIIVEGCTIELSEDIEHFCFEIAFDGNRTYVLAADSQESMEAWMKALTCAGFEYKRLIVAELQRQLDEIEELRNKKSMCQCASDLPTTPKPPPRRQNPFNRPAPPIPQKDNADASGDHMPFIIGQPAGGVPRTVRNGRSAFYVQTDSEMEQRESAQAPPQGPAKPARRQPAAKADSPEAAEEALSLTSFAQMHAEVRALVMRDVEEYHQQKELDARPLIEL